MAQKRFNVLPGFGLTMGFTLCYLSAIVLIPFAGLVLRTLEISWPDFWRLATTDRGAGGLPTDLRRFPDGAVANAVFGTLLAWVLVRYEFPGAAPDRRDGGFPIRAADRGGGLDAGQLFRGQRLAGASIWCRWESKEPSRRWAW